MRSNEFYFYWYFRKQTLIDIAASVFNFLKEIHPILKVGEWRTAFDEPVSINACASSNATLLNHFKREIKRHYRVKEVADLFSENAGTVFTLKSSGPQGIKLEFIIGASHPDIPNSLVVEGLQLSDNDAQSLFELTVKYFDADWAAVTNFRFVKDVVRQARNEFWVGWLLFFSRKITFDYSKLNSHFFRYNEA